MQVETITTTAREQTTISMTRVHDLRDRIAQLKLRFTENELKVEQAAEAVRAADELAARAELVTNGAFQFGRKKFRFDSILATESIFSIRFDSAI